MMTVKELIAWLEKLPPDMGVRLASWNGIRDVEDLADVPFMVCEEALFIDIYDTYLDGSISLEAFISQKT